ncbi:RICIN domain-containing protein [Streptomyces chryseus]
MRRIPVLTARASALTALAATILATTAVAGTASARQQGPATATRSSVAAVTDYQIVSRANGMEMYIKNNSTDNGTPVRGIRRSTNDRADFQWTLRARGDGNDLWEIRNTSTNKCIQASGTEINNAVVQQPCDQYSPAQQWQLTLDPLTLDAGDDTSGITPKHAYLLRPMSAPGLAITVRDPGNNEWSELILDKAVASTDRLWRFLRPGQV